MRSAQIDQTMKFQGADKPDLLIDAKSEVSLPIADLLAEAWRRADLTEAFHHADHLNVVVNMERIIGQTMVVNAPIITTDGQALFSRRRYRRYFSRVIRRKTMPSSKYLSLVCDRREPDWWLRRAEIGAFIAPEPMEFADILRHGTVLPNVLLYWTRHARVYQTDYFTTPPHGDSWARVLSKAQLNHRPEVLQQVGYFAFAAEHDIAINLPIRRG